MLRFLLNLLLINQKEEPRINEVEDYLIMKYSRGDVYLKRGLYLTREDEKKMALEVSNLHF